MANNYGQPDAGSMMGAVIPSADAHVRLNAPQAVQPGQSTANPWKASWRTVNGVGDYYYEKSPGNWQVIPDHVRNSNKGQFGLQAVQGRRAADEKAEQKGQLAAISAKQDQIRRDDLAYRDKQDAINERRYNDAREDTNNLRRDTLNFQRDNQQAIRQENALNRDQSDRHFNANQAAQNKQLELNNQLMGRKLDIEDRHFQQKLAYDKRMDRRAQIISSLSLVAQSLARL